MSSSDRPHIDKIMGRDIVGDALVGMWDAGVSKIAPPDKPKCPTQFEILQDMSGSEKPLFPQIAADEAAGRNYQGLKEAVEKLYRAAYWTPDRQCDAEGLWEAVRDKAGIEPGKSTRNTPGTQEDVVRWVRSQLGVTGQGDKVLGMRSDFNGGYVITVRVDRMERHETIDFGG